MSNAGGDWRMMKNRSCQNRDLSPVGDARSSTIDIVKQQSTESNFLKRADLKAQFRLVESGVLELNRDMTENNDEDVQGLTKRGVGER